MPILIGKDNKPYRCFVHIPKTGGTWVRRAIENSKRYKINVSGYAHQPVVGLDEMKDIKTFMFIRCPLTWYKSLFHIFKIGGRINGAPKILMDAALLRRISFNHWVNDVLEFLPGFATDVFREYGAFDRKYLRGRTEYLANDLNEMMHDLNLGKDLPKMNVSDAWKYFYSWEQVMMIRDREDLMFETFHYDICFSAFHCKKRCKYRAN